MKKYLPFYIAAILLQLLSFVLAWGSSYRHMLSVATFAFSVCVFLVLLLIVKDGLLKRMKLADDGAYQLLSKQPANERITNLHIDKAYPYNEEATTLFSWWATYQWLSGLPILLSLVLIVLSDS